MTIKRTILSLSCFDMIIIGPPREKIYLHLNVYKICQMMLMCIYMIVFTSGILKKNKVPTLLIRGLILT